MKLYDLSHPINNEIPVYPGKEQPRLIRTATIAVDGYCETRLTFDSHQGTHIDAPAHMLAGGMTLDQMQAESFTGQALIISVPEKTRAIEKQWLVKFQGELLPADFVLFRTGWSKYWGTQRYFIDFPVLTPEALSWLLEFQLKGIGFDAISADPVDSTTWDNHFAIFNKGLLIIENLVFPDNLKDTNGRFSCFPIPFEKADGSPVRAVLETK